MTTLTHLLEMADAAHDDVIRLAQVLVRFPQVSTGPNSEPHW